MICSYCQTEQPPYLDTCAFCGAPMIVERPTLKYFLHLDQAELPFEELRLFHTYDLLILLRLVREERSDTYKLMRTLQRDVEGVLVDSDTKAFAESEYRRYTARMRVLEGILIDRMGYKPKRIDDNLLAKLKERIENG